MSQSSPIDLDALQHDLDAFHARVLADVGEGDAEHIRSVRLVARCLEVSGRVLIHVSLEPVSFGLGVLSLGLYRILENMEIGHNVLHGQYDFMNDPTLDSRSYEWDIVGPSKSWKRAHNVTHHTYTNVLGKDDDFGYTAFRFSSDVPWRPLHLLQPIINPLGGLFFDHMVSLFDVRISQYRVADVEKGTGATRLDLAALRADWLEFARKAAKKYAVDYLFYPALAGPLAPKVALGNALSNGVRNLWTYAVIHCGHLTEGTSTFREQDLPGETRGGYYLRQIMGSSNFEAGPLLGILTGHLSHQIEHHLFPDVPAYRYRAMSADVRRICEKHGIPYNTGSFSGQLKSMFRALFKYSVPKAPSNVERRGSRLSTAQAPRAALHGLAM